MNHSLCVILLTFGLYTTNAWHIYDQKFSLSKANESCKKYYEPHPSISQEYHLWPNLINPEQQRDGSTLYGMNEAMREIWKNQHPVDCKAAKYAVSYGFSSGFGSQVHVEGAGFTYALNSGRVYLRSPGAPKNIYAWQTDTQHCRDQKTDLYDCYYLPWSNCTLQDALGGDGTSIVGHMTTMSPNFTEAPRTVIFMHSTEHPEDSIPTALKELMYCSPIEEKFRYYWWRAITATFMLRPNTATLLALSQFDKLPIADGTSVMSGPSSLGNNTHRPMFKKCIAMHVRRGDKHIEMQPVPFSMYAEAAESMWNNGIVHNHKHNGGYGFSIEPAITDLSFKKEKGVIFLGTEDPGVIREAVTWGRSAHWHVVHTSLFKRSDVTARANHQEQLLARQRKKIIHHDLEYMSILLNLEYAMKCDAWVCTLASNTCRLMDELRTTIGGKANYAFADLSKETCSKPPCYDGKNIYSLSW